MTEPRDFRPTVFLPKTDFPMKAGLPQKEPGILARWQAEDIYRKVREARKGREKFILHDGPPYANGDMHIGHALNHILKDMVCRTQNLLGKDAPYVPGWDCHGLPIEWKVEEEYRKKKKNKDEVPPKEFRAECRAYAQKWVDVQREQLKRLGINGDWDNPYLTMDSEAEGTIVRELLKFAESGQLYRGAKPVMWSPVEKTALAEAEVEYEDITSTQIDVAFEIVESPIAELVGAYAVIWTTTPWTIPVNQALAYGPEVDYVVVTSNGKRCLVAKELHQAFQLRSGQLTSLAEILDEEPTKERSWEVDGPTSELGVIKGSDLAGTICQHPMANLFRHPVLDTGLGSSSSAAPEGESQAPDQVRGDGTVDVNSPLAEFFLRPRPLLAGDFVTTDSGTGLVHMAPDHGEDDFALCKANGIEPVFAVLGDGKYREDWAWLGGQGSVINPKFNAPDGPICTALREAGGLLAASADYKHSYPHSWRSKAKVIYRCTPQWFVPMDKGGAASGGTVLPVITAAPEDSDLVGWRLVMDGAPAGTIGYHRSLDYIVIPVGDEMHVVREAHAEAYCVQAGVKFRMAALIKGALLAGATAELDGVSYALVQDDDVLPEGNTGFSGITATATLREKAIKAIAETRWVPEKGRNRIGAMVEGRPDWVLSRQRAWGVPITLFVDRKTGQYLNDPDVNARIVAAVMAGGVDAWDEEHAQEYLGDAYKLEDYERVTDILDVWFDSGSTHAFVLESGRWPDLLRPEGYTGPHADLYLEGSDQHRGWFQSSLLEACATRGHAPYKAVLTHGFTMDQKGMKMSKSLGNTISPIDLMRDYGADILRLWALSVDFTEDHRIGKEILQGVADQYRKLRNTYRYLLGALEGFTEAERLPVEDMPELERYMLGLLGKLDATLRQAVDDFDFNTYVRALTEFCNEDLSAFFFDIRKDSLYCDAPTDLKRRAYRTVLDTLFHALVRYGAPVLVFTSEEVWSSRYPDADSVHLLEWPQVPAISVDEAHWTELRALRQTVNEAIEPLRREKVLGSGLEAIVTVPEGAPQADLAELFITATVTRGQGREVTVERSSDHKCGRCWRLLPEVSEDGALCGRCEDVVAQIDAGVEA
ncbi:MAG: isoleucine--tRNA ligase [Novosphingobium sp. 32-60-15]|uniref:isoleucine--tRNA ligase n=1 Tax=unclassified Novosphingobium TaxID=2644732 RepID=UPI000BCDFA31|nr:MULTISPECIES: isoleucine--tRNA ligase [unclassified Novosphingobium]OYX60500.1 MAG: isoleucine--tRNA ligase [Novosphingobium sp. 32-60-15]